MAAQPLENLIRRKLLKRFRITVILFILFCACLSLLASEGLLNMAGFLSPYNLDMSIARINALAEKPWLREATTVSLTANVQDIPGLYYVITSDDLTVCYSVVVSVEGRHVLCYLSKQDFETFMENGSHTFTGTLLPIDVELAATYLPDMMKSGYSLEEAKDILYPYYIDIPEIPVFMQRLFAYSPLVIPFVLFAVTFAKNIRPVIDIRYYTNKGKTPVAIDMEKDLPYVDEEFADTERRRSFSPKPGIKIYLTKHWFIMESKWNVEIHKADEFLWAYRELFTVDTGINIEVTNTYLRIMSNTACIIVIVPGKAGKLKTLMEAFSEAYPWMLIGYRQDWDSDWQNNIQKMADSAKSKKQKLGFVDFKPREYFEMM